MNLFEWGLSHNPQWVLTNLQVVDICAEIAKKFKEVDEEGLAGFYLDQAQYLTKLLGDEAKQQPSKGVFTLINKVPKTLNDLCLELDTEDKDAVRAELKELIKQGLVIKPTEKTYARYDGTTQEQEPAATD